MAEGSFKSRRQHVVGMQHDVRRLQANLAHHQGELMARCHHNGVIGCTDSEERYCLDCGYYSAGPGQNGVAHDIMKVPLKRTLSTAEFNRHRTQLLSLGAVNQLLAVR